MQALVIFLICISFATSVVFAQKGTYVDSVQFIQYLDESTALEEVKKGNLDIYYSRIPAELIQSPESLQNINVFYTTGGSYSLLVNPAEGNEFNPFSSQQVRFALNYLVDRKLVVDELMGGFGVAMISNYGPFDPDYLLIVGEIEKFNFRYNPELANQIITEALIQAGGQKIDGKWFYDDKPIQITVFIRNDDPVRKSIGEVISSELEKLGFAVKKEFGDLNKAYVIVYGSNPADMKWSIYTEGYAGRSAFVKYDPVGLAQMYAPWFSNMPGFNNPAYWNYENKKIDELTQKIYSSNYTSAQQRADLIRQATKEGINESVRIFLAAKIDPFVANKNVDGVINDFGGGITTRFTPINARTGDSELKIGVKQVYQGAWNPVRGLGDAYSKNVWDALYDPGIFKNPYSGQNFPVRQHWQVVTAGPDGKLDVPDDAIKWDSSLQRWVKVGPNTKATSKITYDLLWSNWHHGQKMDINDVLYSVYFGQEWASSSGENDKTFDPEYSPTAAQSARTFVGMRVIDEDTVEVYVDFWHFDESEIADWGGVWVVQPWEIMAAMEQIVVDGKASFSRTDSQAKSLDWLSLIVPKDASLVKEYLKQFSDSKTIPPALRDSTRPWDYYNARYEAAIKWIEQKKHAVISNGPFYLERYSPEARTMEIKSFDDPSYPFGAGRWQEFEDVRLPMITAVDVPEYVVRGKQLQIPIRTSDASLLYYFVSSASGAQVDSGVVQAKNDSALLVLSEETTSKMAPGGNDLKLYVVSDSVLRPDIYSTSFVAVDSDAGNTVETIQSQSGVETKKVNDFGVLSILVGCIIIGTIYYLRRKKSKRGTDLSFR
ncbi:MAG TPA: ABC transporter substrate-binding protein [Candidatus Nitrosotenuis sp.]|nr:ABC transporter substrate-binding protein [Candidatus Nitrosotenuis sp.]